MSDMLTHWAAFDDCRRLTQFDESIVPDFRAAIEKDQASARLGTMSFGGKTWMQPLLSKVRENYSADNDKASRYLAFALGGLIHQACDRIMKPFLSNAAGSDWSEMQDAMRGGGGSRSKEIAVTQEVSAYVDAEVFRKVYASGKYAPFSPHFMAELNGTERNFEELVRAMLQRSLLATHTLRPDVANLEAWLDNLFDKVQPLYLDVDLWVKVFNHPDPQKQRTLALSETFYRDDDPAIQAAREIQEKGSLSLALREAVFTRGESTSQYGEVLQLGLSYLRSASAFWRGEAEAVVAPNYERSVA